MSDYIVSARKYRPQNWHTVVGQKALVQTLKNAIVGGKLAHAYLFCGPRGVGKTTCARIFAKTINCQHLSPEGEACNECESCQSFNEQRSYNVYELDAASNNSVDNIRELIEQVQIPPQIGRYKVFIIDEVHMLSTAAFNAFLKTLEEPPHHAIFIMATTEKQKILPTILSRCQTYDFQRISSQDIVEQLTYIASQEGIQAEPKALQVIAQKADGGMRDALSVFDQITSFTGGNVSYQATIDNLNILDYETFFHLTDDALQGNIPAALLVLDKVIRRGFDPQYFIGGWASHLRDLMVARDPATLSLIESGPEVAMQYQKQAVQCSDAFLYGALKIASECDFNYRNSRNKRLFVELAIVKICQLLHPVSAPEVGHVYVASAQSQAVPVQPAPARPAVQPSAPAPQPQPQAAAPVPPRPAAPMPQPPVQPQPQAAAPAPRPMTRMAGATPRMVSLKGPHTQAGPATTTTTVVEQEMNEPVSDEALRRCWRQYTQTITEEPLLANLMLDCLPQWVEGTHYKVLVESDSQRQPLERSKGNICSYLRRELRNTHIIFDVEMAPVDPNRRRRAFSPREKFAQMREHNPEALDELVTKFGLELA